jgi:hypothetical protein
VRWVYLTTGAVIGATATAVGVIVVLVNALGRAMEPTIEEHG